MQPLNRRGFLRMLGGAAAAAAAPTYFLPPIGGWTSDVIVKPSSYHTYLIGRDAMFTIDDLNTHALLWQTLQNPFVEKELAARGEKINWQVAGELLSLKGLKFSVTRKRDEL